MKFFQSDPAVLVLAALAIAGAALALGWWLNNRLGRSSLEAARRHKEDKEGEFPAAEFIGKTGLHFGLHEGIGNDDVDFVSDCLHAWFKENA